MKTDKSKHWSDEPTVFVVDDDTHFRGSICELMRSVDIHVEEFASAIEFLASRSPHRVGCMLLDVRMPGMSGLELLRRMRSDRDPLPVILLTAFADVPTAVEAMQCGARDFLEKPCQPQLLIEKIQDAILEAKNRSRRERNEAFVSENLKSLTPREQETLDLLMAGKNAKQIARELSISVRTVDFHRRNILDKMQVDNLVQLTRLLDEIQLLRITTGSHPLGF